MKRVLIVEDCLMLIDGFKSLLKYTDFEYRFQIDVATNCTDAYSKIKTASNGNTYDVVFLDIQLPASEDGQMVSGEDLGFKINELLPETKIIVMTFLTDNLRLLNILKSVKPHAFLIKGEGGNDEVVAALKAVIKGNIHYCNSIMKLLNNDSHNGYTLDKIDRQLLYQISLGTKMKDLPNYLPLEMAGVEKRKRRP